MFSNVLFLDSRSCQQSLGMEDGYIEDFQITSSSELFKHPRSSGRLGRDGWCAGETDMKPYIQVCSEDTKDTDSPADE